MFMIRLYTALKKIDIIRLSYIYIQNEQVLQNYKTKVLILNKEEAKLVFKVFHYQDIYRLYNGDKFY